MSQFISKSSVESVGMKSQFAHIINPVVVHKDSDLFRAQPVTFETMKNAKSYALLHNVYVDHLATCYKSDEIMVPDGFANAGNLQRSILDFGTFSKPKKLPLLADILGALYHSSNAEYLIYTNVDIALMPHFYVTLEKIMQEGYDAVNIFRRTLDDSYQGVDDIPYMYADFGFDHPGTDCFVFKRALFEKFDLQNIAIGCRFVAFALRINLFVFADKIKEFDKIHMTFHIGDDRSWDDLDDMSIYNEKELDNIFDNLEQREDANKEVLKDLRAKFNKRKQWWRGRNVK